MRDSIDTLAFCLENRDRAVLSYRHKEDIMTLAEAEFPHGCDEFYLWRQSVMKDMWIAVSMDICCFLFLYNRL